MQNQIRELNTIVPLAEKRGIAFQDMCLRITGVPDDCLAPAESKASYAFMLPGVSLDWDPDKTFMTCRCNGKGLW